MLTTGELWGQVRNPAISSRNRVRRVAGSRPATGIPDALRLWDETSKRGHTYGDVSAGSNQTQTQAKELTEHINCKRRRL